MTPDPGPPGASAGGALSASPTPVPATIGPYRVEREIARGGMGIVYLAHDTRLDRPAAIKALPDDFAADPERLARFEREARLLASLSHPNIAGIYGVEVSEGRRFLALEHVQGDTLAQRLAAGPLPVDEAIEICIQIAAGIEAAHEAGVIHRDLKPGNVMITPGDVVKVVDFGLAKGKVAPDPGAGDSPALAHSPTISSPTLPHSPTFPISPAYPQSPTIPHSPQHSPAIANSPTLGPSPTMPGVILGTAGYLSPEQARGKAVDRRTDIWSFGCVLYECLTGHLAYDGETVSDTIARILEREPDWSRLPKKTPPRVALLLRRCLEKDPRKRLRDIGEARLALEEARSEAAPAPRPAIGAAAGREGIGAAGVWAAAAGIGGILAGLLLGGLVRGGGPREVPTRLSIVLPPGIRVTQAQMTDDGRTFLAVGEERNAKPGEATMKRLYIRRLGQSTFEPIPGTERVNGFFPSADGKWIVFVAPVSERSAEQQFLRMPIDASAPAVPLAKIPDDWTGRPALLRSGDLLMPSENGKKYVRIPAAGDEPSEPKAFNLAGVDGVFSFGSALPGDRGALLGVTTYEKGSYHISIGVLDLKTGKSKMLVRDAGSPQYSSTGHLLFTRGDALLAAPFDLGSLDLKGPPVAIQGGLRVSSTWSNANIQLTDNGTLLHVLGGNVAKDRRAVIVSADGKIEEWSGERQPFESSLAVSPDGSRFASVIANTGAIYEIWISERGRTASRRVIAVPGVDCSWGIWSPDGSRLAYAQISRSASDGIYVVDVDGDAPARRIFKTAGDEQAIPTDWSPDGSRLLVSRRVGKPSVVAISADGSEDQKGVEVGTVSARRVHGRFSRDGTLVSYLSDEGGRFEVFVSDWDGSRTVGQPLLVSAGAVARSAWGSGSRKLYFPNEQGNKIMAVDIQRTPRLSASAPSVAWDLDALHAATLADVLPDGRLLVILKGEGEDEITSFEVALRFDQELRAKLKGK